MATKGRGGDSMLVHMTPEEVQSLQAMALKGGGTLTINPDTGLPEANFLKKMLPMIAGFALGPAGFGLMSAGMAGAAVGGITALSTGSLSRGLMAGLGAYGGASLGASLAGAGEGALAAGELAKTLPGAPELAGLSSEAAAAATNNYATQVGAMRDAALNTAKDAGFGAKMSAGFGQMASNPGAYSREMLTGLAAISPALADQGVQTATKRPDTGTIRNFTFDPYGQTYSDAGSYPASEYKGMAEGGIVALAKGGFTDAQVASYIQNNNLSGQALKDAGDVFGLNADQLGRAQALITNKDASIQAASDAYNAAVAGRPDLVEQNLGFYNPATQSGSGWEDVITNRFVQDQPGAGFAQINTAKQGSGLTNEDIDRSFDRFGYSDALYHVATSPDWKNDLGLTGFAGLSSNINRWVDNANQLNLTPAEKRARAYADMTQSNMNMKDVVRATGKTIEELFPDTKTKIVTTPTVITGNTQGPGTQDSVNDLRNVGIDRLLPGVSGGGNTVVNANGTITTRPDFSLDMKTVRDRYTQGGGSLGYVNPAPKTVDEFNERFNRQTGDSLAAYEYLMGEGANPIKSGVGEIMRPYSEAVRGIPAAEGRPTQKYIYQNGKYVENPNYRPMSYDSKGNRNVGMTSAEVLKGFNALPDKADDTAIFDWVGENKISIAQLAAAMGVSVAEAQRRMNAIGKKKGAVIDGSGYISDGGGGDGASGAAGASGDGSSGSSGTAGDAAAAAAADGAAADGPGTGAGWAYGGMVRRMALGGLGSLAGGGQAGYNLGGYSDGGRLLKGPGDGVSDSIPASIGRNRQPARLADGEFVVPARIVSELGNGSTEAGARKLYAMMDRVQKARGRTTGKRRVATNTRAEKYLPA
jgi:hypothetical protein